MMIAPVCSENLLVRKREAAVALGKAVRPLTGPSSPFCVCLVPRKGGKPTSQAVDLSQGFEQVALIVSISMCGKPWPGLI